MIEILDAAHSGWRWIVVLFLVVAAAEGLLGWNGNRPWRPRARTLALGATITYDIQVLLGILVYGTHQVWAQEGQTFYPYIHPALMLVGLVVLHVTTSRIKRTEDDQARHRWLAAGTLLTLVIAVAGGAVS